MTAETVAAGGRSLLPLVDHCGTAVQASRTTSSIVAQLTIKVPVPDSRILDRVADLFAGSESIKKIMDPDLAFKISSRNLKLEV